MSRTAIVTGLALATALGGCASMKTGRDRIVQPPTTCQDLTIPIYFEPNEAEIPPEGRRVLIAERAQIQGCQIDAVRVLGLADAVGDPAANLELSKQRAASVAEAIEKAGLPVADFDVAAAGQAGSVTAEGQVRPVRRRVDITVKVSKPK